FEDFGSDDDVAMPHLGGESAAEAGADNEVGPVTLDGHFGGDAGAVFADAEGEHGDGLSRKSAFMEIKVCQPDLVVGISALQDWFQLLLDGDKNGDHDGVKTGTTR